MGNSQAIANEFYLQINDDDFRNAIENDIVTRKGDRICDQQVSAKGRTATQAENNILNSNEDRGDKYNVLRQNAVQFGSVLLSIKTLKLPE